MTNDGKIKKLEKLLKQEKEKSANFRKKLNSLDLQYKSIINSYKKSAEWLYKNAPKLFFLWLIKQTNTLKKKIS